MHTCEIVVAKYKEDTSWLEPVYDKCVIYDKSKDYPNVGREAETYLRYIIEKYDNLPEVVVFTQANIADHRGSNDVKILTTMEEQALQHGYSFPHVAPHDWVWGPDFNLVDQDNKKYKDPMYYHDKNVISYYEYFKKILGFSIFPYPMYIYPNALFAVRKDKILRNTKAFYENIIRTVNHSEWNVEAYFMERSWFYIFNPV